MINVNVISLKPGEIPPVQPIAIVIGPDDVKNAYSIVEVGLKQLTETNNNALIHITANGEITDIEDFSDDIHFAIGAGCRESALGILNTTNEKAWNKKIAEAQQMEQKVEGQPEAEKPAYITIAIEHSDRTEEITKEVSKYCIDWLSNTERKRITALYQEEAKS